MVIFAAANRCLQVSLSLQPRCLVGSAVAKAKKGYSTSGPVRYIPKGSPNIGKHRKAPDLGSGDDKEGIVLRKRDGECDWGRRGLRKFESKRGREGSFRSEIAYSSDVFENGPELPDLEDESNSLQLIKNDVWSKSELIVNEVPSPIDDNTAEIDYMLSQTIKQDAEKLAIDLLAARAFTELQLRKKLRGKKFHPNIVESVVTDFKSRGLLNDGMYAESFSRSRWLSSTWGPRRIKQALIGKGVKETDAEAAMKLVFEDDCAKEDDQSTPHGMSKISMDRLFVQASKQWLRSQSTSPENRKARMVRWLQYRGFNWGVTSAILKKLEAQYPHHETCAKITDLTQV